MRYVAGCHCPACRQAHTRYAMVRAKARQRGDRNGYTDASEARAHLQWLSGQGVGRRAVYAASDVGQTILQEIKIGKRLRIRERTARKILAVTPELARADHALIPAGPTWRLLNDLIGRGYTKTFLAKRMGFSAAIQFRKDLITARNASRVERLYRLIEAGKVQRP